MNFPLMYINEIPLLPKIINTKLFFKKRGQKLNIKGIGHSIVTYIDVNFRNHEKRDY